VVPGGEEIGSLFCQMTRIPVWATRWITAKLRNRRFFSLAELNAAIATLLVQLNDRLSRHLGASRRTLFEQLEQPALKRLPAEPYALGGRDDRTAERHPRWIRRSNRWEA
jgi:hypothetical protein